MSTRCLLQLVIAFAVTHTHAQSVNTLMGARSSGLAQASTTLKDEWSLFNNVGTLAKVEKLSTAFAYEVRPSLQGTNRMAAILNAPFKFGTFGIGLFRFGDDLYSEQLVSAGFSNQFGIASLGVKVNYIQYRAEGFGTKTAWSINFGGLAQITEKIAIGAYITNLNQPKLSVQNDERIPTSLTAGIGFKPTNKILLLAEVVKDLEYDPTMKAALEYTIHKKVFVRTGFNLQPDVGYFGLGFLSQQLRLDYSIAYSSTIRFTHQASAIYFISKRKKNDGK
jgi:hypothetical protein